jgi:hypothetical protein
MPEAPGARLCLAHLYDEDGKTKASLEQYRIIIRDFPETEACRYALAALANGLLILAEQGEGDGKYMSEAVDVLNMFRKKYPKANELPWVERKLLECRSKAGIIERKALQKILSDNVTAGLGIHADRDIHTHMTEQVGQRIGVLLPEEVAVFLPVLVTAGHVQHRTTCLDPIGNGNVNLLSQRNGNVVADQQKRNTLKVGSRTDVLK